MFLMPESGSSMREHHRSLDSLHSHAMAKLSQESDLSNSEELESPNSLTTNKAHLKSGHDGSRAAKPWWRLQRPKPTLPPQGKKLIFTNLEFFSAAGELS